MFHVQRVPFRNAQARKQEPLYQLTPLCGRVLNLGAFQNAVGVDSRQLELDDRVTILSLTRISPTCALHDRMRSKISRPSRPGIVDWMLP